MRHNRRSLRGKKQMTAYTASQLTAMSNALSQANQTGATPATITAALNTYYSVQTSVRGYATLALEQTTHYCLSPCGVGPRRADRRGLRSPAPECVTAASTMPSHPTAVRARAHALLAYPANGPNRTQYAPHPALRAAHPIKCAAGTKPRQLGGTEGMRQRQRIHRPI
jgi:hypothetical protein